MPDPRSKKELKAIAVARARAKEIYVILYRAVPDKMVTMRSVRDALATESHRIMSISVLEKWRKADKWQEVAASGAKVERMTYAHNANLSIADMQAAMSRSMLVYSKISELILARMSKPGIEITFTNMLEGLTVMNETLERLSDLRRQILKDSIEEARDITPGRGGVSVTEAVPALQRSIEAMRAKMEEVKKNGNA